MPSTSVGGIFLPTQGKKIVSSYIGKISSQRHAEREESNGSNSKSNKIKQQ